MPIYDYVCRDCGHTVEVIHGVHAPGPTTCTVCGGGTMRKAVSAAAVVFKGSGWAKKDARSTTKPATSTKDGADSTKSAGGDSSAAATGESSKSTSDSGTGGTAESSTKTSSTSSSSSSEAS